MTPIDAPRSSACDNNGPDRAYSTVWQSIRAQGLYLPKMRALSRLSRFAAIQGSIASPCRADQ
jgi:hypothetical protein